MTARNEGLALIALMITLSFIFQIQMKLFANKIAPLLAQSGRSTGEIALSIVHAALSWQAVLIGSLAVSLFAVWLLVLTRLELSLALPVVSLALVVNAIGSGFLLGEAMSPLRMLGIVVVACGLALVLRS